MLIHGIAEGQPFIEGNKRTAALACKAFLQENGYALDAAFHEFGTWILRLSEGETADELADRLRTALVPLDNSRITQNRP